MFKIKEEKEIQDWKKKKTNSIYIKEFDVPKHLIKVLIQSDKYHGALFLGEGGIGKTELVYGEIKKHLETNEWIYTNGFSTPLSLYKFLYDNKDRKIIIFDDVEGIFSNSISMSILKGCLWDVNGGRHISYLSTSDKAEDLPNSFIMNSKVIILCNNIDNSKDLNTRAMISRTISYNIKLSYKQKIGICKDILESDKSLSEEQKDVVRGILLEHTNEATMDFNFRTLNKLISFVKYNKNLAKKLFVGTTLKDPIKEAFIVATNLSPNRKYQIERFKALTGLSQRSFYRVRKKFLPFCQVSENVKNVKSVPKN